MMKTLQRLMFKVLPDCREAEQLQSRRLDEKLSLYRRGMLWMHCAMCSCCRRFGIQIGEINELCQELPEHTDDLVAEHSMPKESKDRVRKRLGEETRGE